MWKLSRTSVAILSVLGLSLALGATKANAVESKLSGNNHTLFIHNGNVYGMGENRDGEIDKDLAVEYRNAKYLGIGNAKSVASTMRRNAILTYDGKVVMHGRRSGATANVTKVAYTLPIASTDVVQDIALGINIGYYIVNGNVYSWDYTVTGKPVLISNSATMGAATSVAAGSYHALILYANGTVGVIGSNVNGQLGTVTATKNITNVVKLATVSGIKSIAAGDERSFLITTYGDVYGFGKNSRGELGLGDIVNRSIPTLLPLHNVDKIVTGSINTMVLIVGGRWMVSGWHNFKDGYFDLNSLTFVRLTSAGTAADVGIAGDTTFVNYGQSSTMTAWGGNNNGKLGDGTNTERNSFTSMYFTMLPYSIVTASNTTSTGNSGGSTTVTDPSCTVSALNPYASVNLEQALRCKLQIYISMNACIQANPGVQQIGQLCKDLIIPADRGVGNDKKL